MNYYYVDHQINVDLWPSKRALFEAFYGEFYEFIKRNNGEKDLEEHNIKSVQDFYDYADYYADGKENCYAIGFAFHKYFLETSLEGSLETQPETSFIGYCYRHNKFKDFITFLVSFFAYWRNDEGCTCMDPYNYADNFFVSAWAALVDTSKLFYFSSETVYWWQSFRVKYVLDNIPGVFLSSMPKEGLPKIRVAGYEFLGWFSSEDENADKVESTTNEKSLFGKLKRKDVYNYWEKEEKKIKKVYIEDWKRVDPA